MKKLLYIFILMIFPLSLMQCDSEDDLVTKNALEGGLINASTTAINYVVGNDADYKFDLYINQGNTQIEEVRLYKSFYAVPVPWSDPSDTTHTTADSIPAKWSNEVLQETITITNNLSHWITSTPLDYAGLIANLQIDGANLPASDGELRIGDYFNFVVEAKLKGGRLLKQSYTVKMTVSTRFAGSYRCVEGIYYRLGVLTGTTADWPAATQIESVDARTYRVVEWWGLFDGNTWYFQIQDDGTITYPEGQKFNGQPMITCESNPADMTFVNCGNSNYIVKDDVNGKDRLVMTIGYYTSGSGARRIYQVMEKIVE